MIVVNRPGGRILVVQQPDHAAASGTIARRWQRPEQVSPTTWQRFVEAVHRHDEGWATQERRPRLDASGRPEDFKSIPTPEHVAIWQRTLDHLEAEDCFMALVVAQHARWLYTHVGQDHVEDQQSAIRFVESLSHRINTYLAQSQEGDDEERTAVEPHTLARFGVLLGLFDRLSLMLIGGLPWHEPDEEVAFGPEIARLSLQQHAGGIRINPWPFCGGSWDLATQARELPQKRFASEADFAQGLRRSPWIALQHHIEPNQPLNPGPPPLPISTAPRQPQAPRS